MENLFRPHKTPVRVRIKAKNLSRVLTLGWVRGGRISQLMIAPPVIAPQVRLEVERKRRPEYEGILIEGMDLLGLKKTIRENRVE